MHDVLILLEALFFIYISFLAGDIFFRFAGIVFERPQKYILFAILCGYAFFGLVGTLFAFTGLFKSIFLWLVVFAIICLSFRRILFHAQSLYLFFRQEGILRIIQFFKNFLFLKALIFIWILLNLWLVFVPITGNDSLAYHLPIITDIADGGIGFAVNAGSIYSAIPFFAEIFYAVPVVLFGNVSAPFIFQVLQYSILALFIVLAYETIRPFVRNDFLRLALPILILSIFDLQREVLHGGYVDVFGFIFGIASALLLFEMFQTRLFPRRYLFLSAFLLGIALSVKYTGLFFFAINGFVLLWYLVEARVKLRKAFFSLVGYAGIAFLVSGFWYIKNALLFHNPVYPIFAVSKTVDDVGMFIMERNIGNVFLFPWQRFGEVSATDSSSKLIVMLYFLFVYLCIPFLVFVLRRKISMPASGLFFFIMAYTALLFFFSHQIRFLLPAIMLLPLIVVLLCDMLFEYVREKIPINIFTLFIRASVVTFSVAAFILFLANIHYFHVKFLYKTGVYTTEEYIEEIGGQ